MKSYGMSFILTLLFGPLGLLYTGVGGFLAVCFIIMILASILGQTETAYYAASYLIYIVIGWPTSIILGFAAVRHYNKEYEKNKKQEEKKMEEMIQKHLNQRDGFQSYDNNNESSNSIDELNESNSLKKPESDGIVFTKKEVHVEAAPALKPQTVVTAVNLLWASLAVGLVIMLMDFSYINSQAPAAFTNFVLLFTFTLMGFFIFKISAGRNWARITFLIMFIIGMLPSIPIVVDEFSRSGIVGALSVAQIGIQIYALFLLFTQPGSSWFRKVESA